MIAYDYLSEFFRKYGVTHVFYQEAIFRVLMREMEKKKDNPTKYILAHSEQAAGYMADGYARASGRVGVAMCQSIGTGNMVGGIYDAFLSNTPVLAVTGKKGVSYQYKNAYQETEHLPLYQAITRFNGETLDGKQIPYLFRKAFQSSVTGKPGPSHIDVTDHQGHVAEMAEVDDTDFEPRFASYPAFRPAADERDVKAAAEAIAKAEKPVILAGRGAVVSGAADELKAFAEKIDAPVVETPDGKCLLDETDPLWSGITGYYGMDCGNRTAANADLVILVGTQTSEWSTVDYACPPPSVKSVQIDIDGTEIGKIYTDCVGLQGDAKTVLAQLIGAVSAQKHDAWRKTVAGYVRATLDEFDAFMNKPSAAILPAKLCDEVAKALPDDAVVVADTGYSCGWSATMMRLKKTQKYFRAAGSLGWSYPASLGVKCALPDRPVFCFAGDGAMYYHLTEMETAHRYGIKTITIVNANNVLAQSAAGLTIVHKDTPDKGASHFRFTRPSFANLANEFGLDSIVVTKPEEIGPAIRKAMQSENSVVIEAVTEDMSFMPPVYKK